MQTSVRESGTVLIWAPLHFATAPWKQLRLSSRSLWAFGAHKRSICRGFGLGLVKGSTKGPGSTGRIAPGCQGLTALWWVAVEGTDLFSQLCSSTFALSASQQHGTFLALHLSFPFTCLPPSPLPASKVKVKALHTLRGKEPGETLSS